MDVRIRESPVDAAHLTQGFALAVVGIVALRHVVTTLGRAEAGFGALWVPPDRAMRWPRGVQEGDEPWGWHPPLAEDEVVEAPVTDDEPVRSHPGALPVVRRYVLEPRSVAPVTLRLRPPERSGGGRVGARGGRPGRGRTHE
jgi:hypothetical protein